MRRALVLSLLACALGTPEIWAQGITVFREPDKKTRKEIESLISGRGLGVGTDRARLAACARLVEIGDWAVPFLESAIAGRKAAKNPRVRANAIIAASRIGDLYFLDEFQLAIKKDKQKHVVRMATLALGELGRDRDDFPRPWPDTPAGVLARAKLGVAPAFEADGKLPRSLDAHTAAAYLIAAAITMPKAPLVGALRHKKPLVRRAAAVALRVRPDELNGEAALLRAIKAEDRSEIKALLIHALGAPRTKEARKALLKALTDKERDVQIAAALELARGPGRVEDYASIRGAFKAARSDAAGAIMRAVLATGSPDAVRELRKQTGKWPRHYAACALLHRFAFGSPLDGEQEVLAEIARAKDLDPLLTQLAQILRGEKRPEKRRQAAANALENVRGSAFYVGTEERTWAIVDDLLLRIFELDSLATFGSPDNRKKDSALTAEKEGVGRDSPQTVTADEQDLAEFLRPGYFRREDMRGG